VQAASVSVYDRYLKVEIHTDFDNDVQYTKFDVHTVQAHSDISNNKRNLNKSK
jgi:hypothetical protein